jgi:hypothetical protein
MRKTMDPLQFHFKKLIRRCFMQDNTENKSLSISKTFPFIYRRLVISKLVILNHQIQISKQWKNKDSDDLKSKNWLKWVQQQNNRKK